MRNVVLIMTVSLDGYVVAPSGHVGGLPEPEELQQWKLNRIRHAGLHIMGRVTYSEMSRAWPTSTAEYAAPMNDIPKVVFSKTLTEAPWAESSIAKGDLVDEIAGLKAQGGGEIIAWGGAGFAQSLTRAALVDEYAIIIQPVVYGGGKPLFSGLPDALHLERRACTTYASGTTLNVFRSRGWGREL
jgi:dihydrofolate reductase